MTIKNKKTLNSIIIIPARIDSTRLKKKLLRNIGELPMIVRVAKNEKKLITKKEGYRQVMKNIFTDSE